MDHRVEELLEKQKKLTFVLGETLYRLYRSQAVRFLYTSDSVEEEEGVRKLVRLLEYLEDRIRKFEEIYGKEDEEEMTDEESEAERSLPEREESAEEEPAEEEESAEEEKEMPEEGETSKEEAPGEEEAPLTESTAAEAAQLESAAALAAQEEIIKNICQMASFASDAEKRLFEKSIARLQKGSEREREVSIGQIANVADKAALRKVYEIAMRDESSRVRLAVMKNIFRMNDNKNEALFRLGLEDADPAVRMAAIKAVAGRVNNAHHSLLKELLSDGDPRVRGLAVTYLGIYYGKDGAKEANALSADESPYVRKSLLEMLSIVRPDGVMTTIKNLLSDTDEEVKKAAEDALGKFMTGKKKEKSHDKRKK